MLLSFFLTRNGSCCSFFLIHNHNCLFLQLERLPCPGEEPIGRFYQETLSQNNQHVWKKEEIQEKLYQEKKRLDRVQGAQILWVYRSRSRGISHQDEECFYNHRTRTAQSPSLAFSTRTQQETIRAKSTTKKQIAEHIGWSVRNHQI